MQCIATQCIAVQCIASNTAALPVRDGIHTTFYNIVSAGSSYAAQYDQRADHHVSNVLVYVQELACMHIYKRTWAIGVRGNLQRLAVAELRGSTVMGLSTDLLRPSQEGRR